MSSDPFETFLDVPESVDPLVLLDLWADQCEQADIYLALNRRLVQIQQHPRHSDREADIVRRRLRSAAKLLASAQQYRMSRKLESGEPTPPDMYRKFFKLSEFPNPVELLELADSNCTPQGIDIALAERMRQLLNFAKSDPLEVEQMRHTLRVAATLLKDANYRQALLETRNAPKHLERPVIEPPPSKTKQDLTPEKLAAIRNPPRKAIKKAPSKPALTRKPINPTAFLTPFDRKVLAVMVGYGGWNAQSRSRLVVLAESFNVSPDGLVKVVEGLSNFAKSRNARIAVEEITTDLPPASQGVMTPGPRIKTAPILTYPSQDQQEIDQAKGFWDTAALSGLFGLITLLLALASVFLLAPDVFFGSDRDTAADTQETVQDISDLEEPDSHIPAERIDRSQARPASFAQRPTFVGNGIPRKGADAADQSHELPEAFDLIERRLNVAGEPSDSVYRDWDYFLNQIATGWVLMDQSTRNTVEEGIIEVLHASSDRPSISERLMKSLTPISGKLPETIDLWRGAWRTAMLRRIASIRNMSPAIVDQARLQLNATLQNPPDWEDASVGDFARSWLNQSAEQLVDALEYDRDSYDYWELWLAAQRELGVDEKHDLALLHAVELILSTKTDLARPGPSVNVVGRLLGLIDYQRGEILRDRFLAIFNSESVMSHDLWVLTSLLANDPRHPWFSQDMMLPDESDRMHRGRIRDRIAQRWPGLPSAEDLAMASDLRPGFDAAVARRWLSLQQELLSRDIPLSNEDKVSRLLAASRLNESFAFLIQQRESDAGNALSLVDESIAREMNDENRDQSSSGTRRRSGSAIRPGQPIGPDGSWSEKYLKAKRDHNRRFDLLSELSSTGGTDLGTKDAELLVREAYRGIPRDIRTHAGDILIHRFSNGPVVVMQLLDQLSEAPNAPGISELISRVTSSVLPDIGAAEWEIDARIALTKHAMRLTRGESSEINSQTDRLAESFLARIRALKGGLMPSFQPATPEEAGQLLVEAWREVAQGLIVSDPVPGDLARLHRRRVARLELARGPMQKFIAEQLSVLDLNAYATVAHHPSLRARVRSALTEAAKNRARTKHVLDQAIEVEMIITMLHRLRLELLMPNLKGGRG